MLCDCDCIFKPLRWLRWLGWLRCRRGTQDNIAASCTEADREQKQSRKSQLRQFHEFHHRYALRHNFKERRKKSVSAGTSCVIRQSAKVRRGWKMRSERERRREAKATRDSQWEGDGQSTFGYASASEITWLPVTGRASLAHSHSQMPIYRLCLARAWDSPCSSRCLPRHGRVASQNDSGLLAALPPPPPLCPHSPPGSPRRRPCATLVHSPLHSLLSTINLVIDI